MIEIVTIKSLKFDGRISKSWQAELIDESEGLLQFKGVFEHEVDHRKLGLIKKGTVSFEYYWTDRWYNIFRFHEPDGVLRNFYCNVAMPPVLSGDVLEYVDLDLDILADANLNYEILDLDEFEGRRVELNYPAEVVEKARRGLSELIELIENRSFPFDGSHSKPSAAVS